MVNFCAKKEEKLAYPKLVVFPYHYSPLDISKRSVGVSSTSSKTIKSFSNRFEAANSIFEKKFTTEGLDMWWIFVQNHDDETKFHILSVKPFREFTFSEH